MDLDLDQLTDQPTPVRIGGKEYLFSELPLESLGELQKWLRTNVPNPLVAVRQHLDGFDAEQQAALLDQARRDALHWPPKVGTARGAAALLGDEPGQVEVLWVALRVHQPTCTRDQAARLYKQLKREALSEQRRAKAAGEKPDAVESQKVTRIYGIAFGMDELLEGSDPKAGETPAATASPSQSPSPGT